jgi:hypothetical protein
MKRSLFLLSLATAALAFSPLCAKQIMLDDVMTREEQKKTGVTKLSLKEKIELENWLNRTFILKAQEQLGEAQLFLSININNGQKLQLSDESIWEIAPSDKQTAAVWITPFPVKIIPSDDPNYPFLIVNINTGISVKAKKLIEATPAETETSPNTPNY